MFRSVRPKNHMRLGSGSFGQVTLRRECAVKRTDMFDSNHEVFDENVNEAVIAATLRDAPVKNVIRAQSVEVDSDGIIHTSMECGSQTFSAYLCTLSLEERTHLTVGFVWQIRQGLQSLHRMGLVHGDLKVTNIMVVGKGEAGVLLSLIDFGASRTMVNRAGQEVQKVDCGTYEYAAPESLASPQVPTMGWDAWSLGCIIHYLIQGRDLVDMPEAGLQNPAAYIEFHKVTSLLTPQQRFGDRPSDIAPELFEYMQALLMYDPTLRATLDHVQGYTAQVMDPLPLHPDLHDEREETINWFYQTYWPQRQLVPLAVNLMDRYSDIAGWPASVTVLQSCMFLANSMLTPGISHMHPRKPDKKAVMHVARTLKFRLYADTVLSLLNVFWKPLFVDHECIQRALCTTTHAWDGVDAYEADSIRV